MMLELALFKEHEEGWLGGHGMKLRYLLAPLQVSSLKKKLSAINSCDVQGVFVVPKHYRV